MYDIYDLYIFAVERRYDHAECAQRGRGRVFRTDGTICTHMAVQTAYRRFRTITLSIPF